MREAVRDSKAELTWTAPRVLLPKNKVKLLLNLVALGAVALPRGGVVNVEIEGTPPDVSFIVKAKGDSARLNDQVKSLLSGANGVAVVSAIVGARDIRQATRTFLHLLGRGQTP